MRSQENTASTDTFEGMVQSLSMKTNCLQLNIMFTSLTALRSLFTLAARRSNYYLALINQLCDVFIFLTKQAGSKVNS